MSVTDIIHQSVADPSLTPSQVNANQLAILDAANSGGSNAITSLKLPNPPSPAKPIPLSARDQLAQVTSEQQARQQGFFNPIEDAYIASYSANPNLAKAQELTSPESRYGNTGRARARSLRQESRYGGGTGPNNFSRLANLSETAGSVGQLNNARLADIERKDGMANNLLNNALSQTRGVTSGLSTAAGLEQGRETQLNSINEQKRALDQVRNAKSDAERDVLTGQLISGGVALLQDDDFSLSGTVDWVSNLIGL